MNDWIKKEKERLSEYSDKIFVQHFTDFQKVLEEVNDEIEKNKKMLNDWNGEQDDFIEGVIAEWDAQIKQVTDISREIGDTALQGASDIFSQMTDNRITELQRQVDSENELLDEQLETNQDRRNKEMISEREFQANEKALLDQKVKNEEAANKKIADQKKKLDLINRAGKIFEIGIGTARNVVEQPGPFGTLIPYWLALGALQSSFVLAQPLPKYAKGTLSLERGNNALGVDTIPILANEGEAITPTAIAREYRPTLAAMHKRSIPSQVLNSIANNYHKNKQISTSFEIDYDKLGESLSYYMRDSNNVKIKNVREFADALRGERHNVFIH
jgi:hypothetical protein